jgi:hypothetical protein
VTGERITRWINGDTNGDNQIEGAGGRDRPESKLFMLERYTGVPRVMEVQP